MNPQEYKRQVDALEQRAQNGENIAEEAKRLLSQIPATLVLTDLEREKSQALEGLGFSSQLSAPEEEDFRELLAEYEGVLASPDNMQSLIQKSASLISNVSNTEEDIQKLDQEIKTCQDKTKLLEEVLNLLDELL